VFFGLHLMINVCTETAYCFKLLRKGSCLSAYSMLVFLIIFSSLIHLQNLNLALFGTHSLLKINENSNFLDYRNTRLHLQATFKKIGYSKFVRNIMQLLLQVTLITLFSVSFDFKHRPTEKLPICMVMGSSLLVAHNLLDILTQILSMESVFS